jgi:ubiquinone/menaquinone biosynthesis C-methylase UbiE
MSAFPPARPWSVTRHSIARRASASSGWKNVEPWSPSMTVSVPPGLRREKARPQGATGPGSIQMTSRGVCSGAGRSLRRVLLRAGAGGEVMTSRHFIPGARFGRLTPAYDRLCRMMGFGERMRAFETGVIGSTAGKRLIEVGCGTGELLRAACREATPARVVGLDPDPAMLAQAEAKLRDAGIAAELVRGTAEALPFPDGSFDLVLSSLMLHHLDTATKRAALREWRRVLAPGGSLVLVDFGVPRSRLLRLVLWPARFGLHEQVGDNLRGRVPAFVREAGFSCEERGRYADLLVAYVGRPG